MDGLPIPLHAHQSPCVGRPEVQTAGQASYKITRVENWSH